MTDELKQLLEDLLEYMDSKADADHDGENWQPNAEMKLKERIEEVLKQPQQEVKQDENYVHNLFFLNADVWTEQNDWTMSLEVFKRCFKPKVEADAAPIEKEP